ncbi:hypothetical protein L1887_29244 [Cichorium endivia]|nr:hypothetical protein L1887_29244 [Cichorium endivia]
MENLSSFLHGYTPKMLLHIFQVLNQANPNWFIVISQLLENLNNIEQDLRPRDLAADKAFKPPLLCS